MIYTSASINKEIKRLQEEKEYILSQEEKASIFVEVEGAAPNIPEYDYSEVQSQINRIDDTIAKMKHALNVFNVSTTIKDSDLTIDEALVRMAQLNNRKNKLDEMRKRLKKQRKSDTYRPSNLVEYVCVNYELEDVKKDYAEVIQQITELQMKLDYTNQTETFEV